MEKRSAKKILKAAVLIYLVSFLIVNWVDVSWVFNYTEVSSLVSDFFNPYPSIDASTIDTYFYPNHSQPTQAGQTSTQSVAIKNIKINYTDKQNTIEIPKISVSVPIIFSTSTNKAALSRDLEAGTVYYPGSVYPGQAGQIVILGHSAPSGWPNREKIGVFSHIGELQAGDSIYIDINNQQYTYIVTQKTVIIRGADVPADSSSIDSNVLTLISCWPPGQDYQRITVQAELQKS